MNKPTKARIFTGCAIVGVVASNILSFISGWRSNDKIKAETISKGNELIIKEKAKVIIPEVTAPVIVAGATIAGICASDSIYRSYSKELISTCALATAGANRYKDACMESTNDWDDIDIENFPAEYMDEPRLFFDFTSLSYYETTPRIIIEAEKVAKQAFKTHGMYPISAFCEYLSGDQAEIYDDRIAWVRQDNEPLIFTHNIGFIDDDLECVLINCRNDISYM